MRPRRTPRDAELIRHLTLEPILGIAVFIVTLAATWEGKSALALTVDTLMLAALCLLPWRPWTALTVAGCCFIGWGNLAAPGIMGFLAGGIFTYNWFKNQRIGRWWVAAIHPMAALTLWIIRYSWDDFFPNLLLAATIPLFALVTGTLARRQLDNERKSRQESEQALRANRLMMASELHDSVAQTQTLVVRTLEDLLEDHQTSEALTSALLEALDLSRQAAMELRAAMAALRNVDQDFATLGQHSGTSLREQWNQTLSALDEGGFDTEAHFEIEEIHLTPDVEHSASRILGELVTNLIWHGAPGPCSISVTQQSGHIVLRTTNIIGPPAPPKTGGGGAGLLGVRERVRLLNGSCTFGPKGQRWYAEARVPVTTAS